MYEKLQDSFQTYRLTKMQQKLNDGLFWPQKSSRAKRHIAWRDIAVLHDLSRYVKLFTQGWLSVKDLNAGLPLGYNLNSEVEPMWKFVRGGETLVRKPEWFGDDLLEWFKNWVGDPDKLDSDSQWKLYYPASPFVTDFMDGYVFTSLAYELAKSVLYEIRGKAKNFRVSFWRATSLFGSVSLVKPGSVKFPSSPVVSSRRDRVAWMSSLQTYDTAELYDEDGNFIYEPEPKVEEDDIEWFTPDNYVDLDIDNGWDVPCLAERALFETLLGCDLADLALPVSSQKIFKRKYNGDFIIPGPSGHMVDACYDAVKCLLSADLFVENFIASKFSWADFIEHPEARFYRSTMCREIWSSQSDDTGSSDSDRRMTYGSAELTAGDSSSPFYQVSATLSRDYFAHVAYDEREQDFSYTYSSQNVSVTTMGVRAQEDGDRIGGQDLNFRMYFASSYLNSFFLTDSNGQPIVTRCRMMLPVTVSKRNVDTKSIYTDTYHEVKWPGEDDDDEGHTTLEHKYYEKYERDDFDDNTVVWVPITLAPLISKYNRDAGKPMLFRSAETFLGVLKQALGAAGCSWAFVDPASAKIASPIGPPELPGGGDGCNDVSKSSSTSYTVEVRVGTAISSYAWPVGTKPAGSIFTSPLFVASWRPECLDVIWK